MSRWTSEIAVPGNKKIEAREIRPNWYRRRKTETQFAPGTGQAKMPWRPSTQISVADIPVVETLT
jgi:hypothetical protein